MLGAEKITFSSVAKALAWYARNVMDPDDRASMSMLPDSRGANSAAYLAGRDLTCAAITLSLQGLHHAELLVRWCSSRSSQEDLAKDEGFPSVYALKLTLRHTECLVEPRLRERGVLE